MIKPKKNEEGEKSQPATYTVGCERNARSDPLEFPSACPCVTSDDDGTIEEQIAGNAVLL